MLSNISELVKVDSIKVDDLMDSNNTRTLS